VNTSILKDRTAPSMLMNSDVDPQSTYGQRNTNTQKIRFKVDEKPFRGDLSVNSVQPTRTLDKRIQIINKNTRKLVQSRRKISNVKIKGPNRKISVQTNNTFVKRKCKKANPNLLIDEDFKGTSFKSVKQSKALKGDLSNIQVDYSQYHNTIGPSRSDLPKFVRPPGRKGGFKSTNNTRLPKVNR